MQTQRDHRLENHEVDCVTCGHDRVPLEPGSPSRCPDCGTSFSLAVHDGFALVERDGWTTRVATDPTDATIVDRVDG